MTIEQIASLLLQSSRARAWTARELAGQLRIPVPSALLAMACAAEYATGRPCDVSDTSETFDRVLARCGRAVAAMGAGSPRTYPLRTRYVMRPSVLAFAVETIDDPRIRSHAFVKHQIRMSGSGLMAPSTSEARGNGPTPGTPGVYASAPGTQWTYVVKAGDSPSTIAQKITGNGGLTGFGNYSELIDANPGKPTVGTRGTWGFNFASLLVGENIKIPVGWDAYMTEDGQASPNGQPYPANPNPVGPAPSAPAPDGTYSAGLPSGRVTALKLELGAWGKKTGSVTTYPGPFDVNDTIDESFRGALAQFQQWSNANQSTSLRTDGTLDQPTADALDAWAVANATAAPAPSSPIPPVPAATLPWLPPVATTPVATLPQLPPFNPAPTTPITPPVFGPPPPSGPTLPALPSMQPAAQSKPGSGGGGLAIAALAALLAAFKW